MSFFDEIDQVAIENTPVTKGASSFLDELDAVQVAPTPVKPTTVQQPLAPIPKEYRNLTTQRGMDARMAQDAQQTFITGDRKSRENVVKQLQSDIDNGIAVDVATVAQYPELKFPEMEKPKAQPKAVATKAKPEPVVETPQPVEPEAQFAPSNIIGDDARAVASLSLGVADAGLSAVKGLTDLNESIPVPQFIKNVRAKIASVTGMDKLPAKLDSLISEVGMYRNQIKDEIVKESGGGKMGVAAKVASDIADGAAVTALTLAGLGATGFVGKGATIRSAIAEAAKFGGFTYATTPGTPVEKMEAASKSALFMLTPIPASKMPKDWMAKVVNVAENIGLNTPAYIDAVKQAKANADAKGTPDEWVSELVSTATPILVNDTIFGLAVQSGKVSMGKDNKTYAKELIASAPKEFFKPVTKAGVDTVEFNPLGPIRIEVPKTAAEVDLAASKPKEVILPAEVPVEVVKAKEVVPEVATMPVEPSKVVAPILEPLPVAKVKAVAPSPEARKAAEETYHRYSQSPTGASDVPWMMFSKNETDVSGGYGKEHFTVSDKGAVDAKKLIPNIQRVLAKHPELLESYQASAKDLASESTPKRMVESAGIWDSPDIVQVIYDEVLASKGITKVRTPDGLMIFDSTDMQKVGEPMPMTEPLAPVKGPGLEGGPGAAAAKGEGEFFQGVSIKNAYTDSIREGMGFPKADKAATQSWEQAKSKAEANLRANPNHEIDLIAELKNKPRATNDIDDFHLTHATLEAEKMYNDAANESNRLYGSGDAKAIAENSVRMQVARDRLQEITDIDRAAGTQTGRGLNARKALVAQDFSLIRMETTKRAANEGKPLTPEQIAEVKRVHDEIAKNPTNEKLKKAWKDGIDRDKRDPDRWGNAMDAYLKENKVELPRGVSDQIKSEMKNAVRLPDENARNKAILKVLDKINGHVPLKAWDWFNAYVYTNMLSGPMSQVRNVLGNVTNQLALRPLTLMANKDFRGAGTYVKKSLETIGDGSAWDAAMLAFRKGGEGKMIESLKELPENASPVDKLKQQISMAKRMRGPVNKIGNVAWKSQTWIGKFMSAADMYSGHMIEAGEKARLIQAGKSPEFADKQAKLLANKYLYRDRLDTPDKSLDIVSKTLEHIGLTLDMVRNIPGLGRGARLAIPFLKTPVKIAEFNAQVSPLGFIGANKNRIANAHYKTSYNEIQKQLQQELANKTPNQEKVKELQDQIDEIDYTSTERKGKAAVGTMIGIMGALMAGTGNTIWAFPKDKKARELAYDAGYRPYSFRIPGTKQWVPMMYLGSGMLAFAIPAAIRDVMIDNPETRDQNLVIKMAKIGMAIPSMFVDQLPLEGLSSMLDMMQGKEDWSMKKVLGRTAMQLVPTSGMLQWIRNMTDPVYRKPITVLDTIKAGIPGLSDQLEARVTSDGLDAKMDIWDALSPYKIGKENEKYIPDYKDRLQILREKMQLKRELADEK